jgi:pyruvate-formate lyase
VVGFLERANGTLDPTVGMAPDELELRPNSRSFRLRERYWRGTREVLPDEEPIAGCGEDTMTGHARDFAALLAASEPSIQGDERIVGGCLVMPPAGSNLNLGKYDPHFPPGHETILSLGLAGMRDTARGRLAGEKDSEKREFLAAVALAYDAACGYVQKVSRRASAMATREVNPRRKDELDEIAAVCHELASAPPSSFHAALQLVQFTRIFGGRGCIGRFDQWMLPYYRRDIAQGTITQQEAQELLECFFIKLNEFTPAVPSDLAALDFELHRNDSLRNITLAGQTRDGHDGCNELTYMCLKAAARLMLPEPKLNVRFFPGSSHQLMRACCRVLAKGANVLAIYNDDVAIPALVRLGIPMEDARDYCNDGCSELIVGGKSFTSFKVHDALLALRETVLHAAQGPYPTFRDVMQDFKRRLLSFVPKEPRGDGAITFPYFAASVEDCLQKASATGARYSLWGSILGEIGNAADGLAAINKFIYQERLLDWADLLSALDANYEGCEPLRQMLRNRAPKYGNDDDAVDAIAQEIAEFFCDSVHRASANQVGHGAKEAAGFMLFTLEQKKNLPASPDGRRQGEPVANSFSPAVGCDKNGPTAVIKSASKIELSKASYGSVLDIALHTSIIQDEASLSKFVSLLDCFLKLPSTATLQVNLIDRETLLRARDDPDAPQYRTLIVRVWGFSAVFVELPPALQEHVLARTEHRVAT